MGPSRLTFALAAAVLLLSACRARETDEGGRSGRAEAVVDALHRFIIPPVGTAKVDVDAVFGEPKRTEKLHGKGSPANYPMHTYQLLDPGSSEFRAFLYVTYRDDRVRMAGINHVCVSKGWPPGPRRPEVQAQIERENADALRDLIEIKAKFADRLSAAPWNAGR